MELTLRWRSGVMAEIVNDEGHLLISDGAVEAGGQNAGFRPMQLVLAGLMQCTTIDLINILRKMRQPFGGIEIAANGRRSTGIPAVFEHIHLHFIIRGGELEERKVRHAVTLALENYCSVAAMLRHTAVIDWSLHLE